MKEQMFLITDEHEVVQRWLDKGWRIISVTAQHVASGSQIHTTRISGKFAIVLEK
jgi:hypothetical protein